MPIAMLRPRKSLRHRILGVEVVELASKRPVQDDEDPNIEHEDHRGGEHRHEGVVDGAEGGVDIPVLIHLVEAMWREPELHDDQKPVLEDDRVDGRLDRKAEVAPQAPEEERGEQITPTMVAVTSSIRMGGTSPPESTVVGARRTTPTESAPATASLKTSPCVSQVSRIVGPDDTPADSQRPQPDVAPGAQSGYSSFRKVRGSWYGAFGVRSSSKLKYGATNGSGAITV